MIVAENLQKSYEGLDVLKGVSLTVNKGDVVCLVGPSGCGKSTFLRCLTRLEEPTGGKVYLDGVEVTEKDIDKTRAKMGMVFQHFNLFPHLTVKRNITLAPTRLHRMTKDQADKRAMELLERIGLADKADAYPSSLSGGQKQRIAIARTLLRDNDILILDDSLSAVDTETDQFIREALKARREAGGRAPTTFIISHRITTLADADWILVVEDGRIAQQGTHADLIAEDGLYRRVYRIQAALEDELNRETA